MPIIEAKAKGKLIRQKSKAEKILEELKELVDAYYNAMMSDLDCEDAGRHEKDAIEDYVLYLFDGEDSETVKRMTELIEKFAEI